MKTNLTDGYAVKRFEGKTKRYCQTLELRDDPSLVSAYRQLHSQEGIWPEILAGIRAAGVLEMEIYLLGTRLFMIVELPAELHWKDVMERMASQPRQEEWETCVARFQRASASASSDEKWKLMERIFHLYD